MKRLPYQYQLLRFMPDSVSEEFVNVGVVMYNQDKRFLKVKIINRYSRITQFFEGVNGSYLMQTLKHIKAAINKLAATSNGEALFTLPENLDQISSKILPKDDSALYFTPVNKGLDVDLESAFQKLCERFVYEATEEDGHYTDREVWTKLYKPFFEKHGLAGKLSAKTVKTTTDLIKFDTAYKNGHWNCIEGANFELKHKDSIENKVFRLIGKLDALSSSNETLEYHVLARMKKGNSKQNKYIEQKLQGHHIGNATINLVTEKTLPDFLAKVKADLED